METPVSIVKGTTEAKGRKEENNACYQHWIDKSVNGWLKLVIFVQAGT